MQDFALLNLEVTLDEAPFAYRNIEDIAQSIEETVTIDSIIKPVYNFKAGKKPIGRAQNMIIQLSSGQGPAECELAVSKLFQSLKQEFDDIRLLSCNAGRENGCYSSILLKKMSHVYCTGTFFLVSNSIHLSETYFCKSSFLILS